MKRLFHIFELSKNEQRVVLLVVFALITIAFVGYQRRVHDGPAQPTAATDARPSPTAAQDEGD
jgi:hypothetical protein